MVGLLLFFFYGYKIFMINDLPRSSEQWMKVCLAPPSKVISVVISDQTPGGQCLGLGPTACTSLPPGNR